MRRVSLFPFVLFACAALLVPSAAYASAIAATDGTEWDFTAGNYNASFGTNVMSNWGTMASNSAFGTSTGFGGPAIPGKSGGQVWVTDQTMRTTDGLAISTGAANGGGTMVNQYTLIMDVMSVGGNDYRSFYSTDPTNTVDSSMALQPDGTIGYETTGGSMSRGTPLTWYRIATVIDAGNHTVKDYINGSLVNTEPTSYVSLDSSKYAAVANSHLLLFADQDNDLGSWFLSSAYYTQRALTGSDIAALGGVQNGVIFASLVPEPSALVLIVTGLVGLLAYAWRKRR